MDVWCEAVDNATVNDRIGGKMDAWRWKVLSRLKISEHGLLQHDTYFIIFSILLRWNLLSVIGNFLLLREDG